MKKTKEINGKVFTVITPRKKLDHNSMIFHALNLNSCYDRPSEAKRYIYDRWMRWCLDVEGLSWFGIQSYNCMMFTLSGLYYDIKEDKYYYLYITKTRQELTELA